MRRKNLRTWIQGIGVLAGLAAGAYKVLQSRASYSFKDRVALITGGSRGLGLLLARQLVDAGAKVAIMARDAEELEQAAQELRARGGTVLTIVGNVGEREAAEGAVHKTAQHYGRLDVLFNNAGIIQTGPFEHMALRDFEEAMATHFYAPLHTTLAALPYLQKQPGARIVNIASFGGKISVPHLLPYCSSKFALVGFSSGLRAALSRHGICVTTVCPGLMRTGSHLHAMFKGKQDQEYFWFALAASLKLTTLGGDESARRIVEACRRGDAELIIGRPYQLAVRLAPLFPELFAKALSLFNRLMPGPTDKSGDIRLPGWASQDSTPPILTRNADRAARANNELFRN